LAQRKKFTEKYKVKQRQTMESLGYWVPLDIKDPYKIYYQEANWKESMINFFDVEALDNLKLYGIFHYNNSKGWVRDHILPRKIGYEYNIPAQLMRHPANLQFISHADNISKGFADKKLLMEEKDNAVDLLYNNILNFDGIWEEHEFCLQFIQGS
jgi:hypothetical protein